MSATHVSTAPDGAGDPFLPVFASMKRLILYSLGLVALSSLIVSFIESIRFILEALP